MMMMTMMMTMMMMMTMTVRMLKRSRIVLREDFGRMDIWNLEDRLLLRLEVKEREGERMSVDWNLERATK